MFAFLASLDLGLLVHVIGRVVSFHGLRDKVVYFHLWACEGHAHPCHE